MDRKHRVYLRINLMSIFFIVVSFISVTLAWFAYSGLSKVATQVGVKAWKINFSGKSIDPTSNNIIVSLSDLYPGMETIHETVNIENEGDSDAEISYKIISARILGASEDNYENGKNGKTSNSIENDLSHKYPFHININLSKYYVKSHGAAGTFDVSLSWPLDSNTDDKDSEWGAAAYEFQNNSSDPSIKIVISLEAQQYLGDENSPDMDYGQGQLVLFDTNTNDFCDSIGGSCISTHVLDTKNLVSDTTVRLLPDLLGNYGDDLIDSYSNYLTLYNNSKKNFSSSVITDNLTAGDILKLISNDVNSSVLVRPNLSDSIIGYLQFGTSLTDSLNLASSFDGSYKYNTVNETETRFSFLSTNTCVWTNTKYGSTNDAYAFVNETTSNGKLYKETGNCRVIPVIVANK